MKYNPKIHNRRSIRLKGCDYSQEGGYFVTICVDERLCLFGNVIDEEMQLNDAGKMIQKWWVKLPEKYDKIQFDEFTIMPNHIHGIISIVGADPRVCPKDRPVHPHPRGEHTGSPLQRDVIPLSRMMQWFKTMSTNDYIRNVKNNGWLPFHKKLWQRNFYERIIRNDNELNKIREYIIYNPQKWDLDRNNPKNWKQINDR